MTSTRTEKTGAKWTTAAGPIQTNKVKKAISKTLSAGNGTRIINDSDMSCTTFMFGQPTPEEAAHTTKRREAVSKVHAKYDGKITRENFKNVIVDLLAEIPALMECQPVRDERKTPEQKAEEVKEKAAARIRNAKRDEARAAQKQKEENEVNTNPKYKELETVEKSGKSCLIQATRNIRVELKKSFPGIKFSVTSDSFSMGNSISVSWTDGPTAASVEDITGKYQYGHFNGMEDIYEYNKGVFNDVYGGTKYLHTSRYYRDGLMDTVKNAIESPSNISDWELEQYKCRTTRELLTIDLTNKGGFLRIEWDKENCEQLAVFEELQPPTPVNKLEIEPGSVTIEDYSEKACVILGDTKPIKDTLKTMGARFNFRLKCGPGWIIQKSRRAEFEEIIKA